MDERGVTVSVEIEMIGGATGGSDGEVEAVTGGGAFRTNHRGSQGKVGFGDAQTDAGSGRGARGALG